MVGKPGSGKTTFAQTIAAYLDEEVGAMVETMTPRDLQLPERVTQYAPLEGDLEDGRGHFLVRPDFVIFDEVDDPEISKFLGTSGSQE